MSRIVTNVQSLVAQRVLGTQTRALNQSLTRLSTGLRINTGADDPAGLIASERLRSDKVAISAAIDNAGRADNVLAVTEGALQEINSLLLELEDLVDRSASEAGLSASEVAANQSQIDSILTSINRIANTSEFAGRKLLAGQYDYTTSSVTAADITDVKIYEAKIPEGSYRTVTLDMVTASDLAFISAIGGGTGAAAGSLISATSIEIRGIYGTEVFSFASGTSMATMAAAIRSSSSLTGVSAVASSTGATVLTSTQYGADGFVTVSVLTGSTTLTLNTTSDYGTNGTVLVNGTQATADGLDVSVRTTNLSADLTLAAAFATQTANDSTFEITGGGARFAISPEIGLVGQAAIGIQAVTTSSLGTSTNGYLNTLGSGSTNDLSSTNFATAQRIIKAAQDQVSSMRGRIGSFQKDTLNTTVNSLMVTLENIAAAESAIRETDFAEATSALTRAQILVNTSTATLQLANAAPQSVLSLLQ